MVIFSFYIFFMYIGRYMNASISIQNDSSFSNIPKYPLFQLNNSSEFHHNVSNINSENKIDFLINGNKDYGEYSILKLEKMNARKEDLKEQEKLKAKYYPTKTEYLMQNLETTRLFPNLSNNKTELLSDSNSDTFFEKDNNDKATIKENLFNLNIKYEKNNDNDNDNENFKKNYSFNLSNSRQQRKTFLKTNMVRKLDEPKENNNQKLETNYLYNYKKHFENNLNDSYEKNELKSGQKNYIHNMKEIREKRNAKNYFSENYKIEKNENNMYLDFLKTNDPKEISKPSNVFVNKHDIYTSSELYRQKSDDLKRQNRSYNSEFYNINDFKNNINDTKNPVKDQSRTNQLSITNVLNSHNVNNVVTNINNNNINTISFNNKEVRNKNGEDVYNRNAKDNDKGTKDKDTEKDKNNDKIDEGRKINYDRDFAEDKRNRNDSNINKYKIDKNYFKSVYNSEDGNEGNIRNEIGIINQNDVKTNINNNNNNNININFDDGNIYNTNTYQTNINNNDGDKSKFPTTTEESNVNNSNRDDNNNNNRYPTTTEKSKIYKKSKRPTKKKVSRTTDRTITHDTSTEFGYNNSLYIPGAQQTKSCNDSSNQNNNELFIKTLKNFITGNKNNSISNSASGSNYNYFKYITVAFIMPTTIYYLNVLFI